MDVLRMKVLLERYRQLKIRIENSRHRICRIKASSFEQYIEEKTYHSPLGERRLQDGKPSHPTETLGMYGRMQFERERDAQLRAEECRLREMQALLWQIDSLIHVFVWQKKPHMEIVERFLDLPHDCKQLVELLCQIAQKYDIQEGGYKPCVRQ